MFFKPVHERLTELRKQQMELKFAKNPNFHAFIASLSIATLFSVTLYFIFYSIFSTLLSSIPLLGNSLASLLTLLITFVGFTSGLFVSFIPLRERMGNVTVWDQRITSIKDEMIEQMTSVDNQIEESFNDILANHDNSSETLQKVIEGLSIQCVFGNFNKGPLSETNLILFLGAKQEQDEAVVATKALDRLLRLLSHLEQGRGINSISPATLLLLKPQNMLDLYKICHDVAQFKPGYFGYSLRGKTNTLGTAEHIKQATEGYTHYQLLLKIKDTADKCKNKTFHLFKFDLHPTLYSDIARLRQLPNKSRLFTTHIGYYEKLINGSLNDENRTQLLLTYTDAFPVQEDVESPREKVTSISDSCLNFATHHSPLLDRRRSFSDSSTSITPITNEGSRRSSVPVTETRSPYTP